MVVLASILVAVLIGITVALVRVWGKLRNLTHQAMTDPLTGVGNRRGLDAALIQQGAAAMALVLVDFDHFKLLNDTYGHSAGDAALVRVTRAMQEYMHGLYGQRASLYRLGGDEFVVTIEGADALHAAAALEGARGHIGLALEPHEQALTFSGGVAASPEHAALATSLTSYADRALYHAKSSGRNRIVTYAVHLLDDVLVASGRDVLRTLADALAAAVDAKDAYTHAHSRNVSDLSLYLARVMGYDDDFVEEIALGALLHDIGKIGVSDHVLKKPGRLNQEEWLEIQSHTEIGYQILSGIDGADRIREMVLYHHERPDGTGYPHGLSGTDIPIAARIIAVADAFDSMTADRVYQSHRTPEEALDEIMRLAGRQFDGDVVDALCQLMVYDGRSSTPEPLNLPVRSNDDLGGEQDYAAAA